MKSPEQIVNELNNESSGQGDRQIKANLIWSVINDTKSFFNKLSSTLLQKILKNKFDVEVKNQIKLPEVQKIDGEVSLKDARALVMGLDAIIRGLKSINDNYTKSTKGLEKSLKPEKIDLSKLEKAVKDIYIPEPFSEVNVKNIPDYSKKFESLEAKIGKIKLDPKIEVKPEAPKVSIDLEGVKNELQAILGAISNLETKPEVNIDLMSVKNAVKKVEDAINGLRFPIPSFKIPSDQEIIIKGNDSLNKISKQINIDENGELMTRSSLIPVPLSKYNTYAYKSAAATFNYQNTGIWANTDGTNSGWNVNIPNDPADYGEIWFAFYGKVLGVRYRYSADDFTVSVDGGDAVQVIGNQEKYIDDEGRQSTTYHETKVITHTNLKDGIHFGRIMMSYNKTMLLHGIIVEASCNTLSTRTNIAMDKAYLAVPTTNTAFSPYIAAAATPFVSISKVIYSNPTDNDITVYWCASDGTIFIQNTIPPLGVWSEDFNPAITSGNFYHYASATGAKFIAFGSQI